MNRILFVCTGNTCRSPMAEGLMRRIIREEGLHGVEVRSAGVAAMEGTPLSDHAATVLQEKQGSGPQRSTELKPEALQWADLVLTMTSSHKRHTIQLFPDVVDKVYTLKEYVRSDPQEALKFAEVESLVTDFQLKQALDEPVTEAERMRILTLQRELPTPDIADPYGGSLRQYRSCADEIELHLKKLAQKLKAQN